MPETLLVPFFLDTMYAGYYQDEGSENARCENAGQEALGNMVGQ